MGIHSWVIRDVLVIIDVPLVILKAGGVGVESGRSVAGAYFKN